MDAELASALDGVFAACGSEEFVAGFGAALDGALDGSRVLLLDPSEAEELAGFGEHVPTPTEVADLVQRRWAAILDPVTDLDAAVQVLISLEERDPEELGPAGVQVLMEYTEFLRSLSLSSGPVRLVLDDLYGASSQSGSYGQLPEAVAADFVAQLEVVASEIAAAHRDLVVACDQ